MTYLKTNGLTQYIPYFVIYLIIINLIGFFVMYVDKQKAKLDQWRIPEKTLLMIALLGGSVGTMVGMYIFRHKTKKVKFTIGFPTILVSEIMMIIYLLIKY